jgi:hypothetical protein
VSQLKVLCEFMSDFTVAIAYDVIRSRQADAYSDHADQVCVVWPTLTFMCIAGVTAHGFCAAAALCVCRSHCITLGEELGLKDVYVTR